MTTPPTFHLLRRDCQDYQEAWQEQLAWVEGMRAGTHGNAVILTEHPPVITLGPSAGLDQIRPLQLGKREIPVIRTDRGGLATCHMPGQLIAYVLWDLGANAFRVRAYVEQLEEVVIKTLGACGVEGERDRAGRGVWVAGKKIAALGLRISRGIAYHGLAINRDPDLSLFQRIIPCGIPDRSVTSLAALGRPMDRDQLEKFFLEAFFQVFGCLPD